MSYSKDPDLIPELTEHIIQVISETNGVSINHTLELLAHDLKSPLSASRRAIEHLMNTRRDGDVELLSDVAATLDYVQGITNDLLRLDHLQSTCLDQPVALDELARACADDRSSDGRIDILTIGAEIRGDAALLRAAIGNLLDNALRHTRNEVLLRVGPVEPGALVMVDDSHATGFIGRTGRGTPEHCGVTGRIDVLTSTLGKALGGAVGGFTAGRAPIVELLRQRSRPYLFSNTLPPAVVGASIAVFDLVSSSTALRDKLAANTKRFRAAMTAAGFEIRPGEHPIVPIMLYEERLAHDMARRLLELGIYVIGFSYPVVPKGLARIRVQLSAAHEPRHIDRAVEAFTTVGRELGVLKAAAGRAG